MNHSSTKSISKIWRYSLPNVREEGIFRDGWAVFLLDEYGMLAVTSAYGNYAHHWPSGGWGDGDFREFLCRLSPSYLIDKLGKGSKEFDGKGTMLSMKQCICKMRRDDDIGKHEARRVFDSIPRNMTSEFDFACWIEECDSTATEGFEEFIIRSPSHDLVMFVEKTWPRFVALLKKYL